MNKTALVTGAYQGIGKAIADLLRENGYTVIYSDIHDAMTGVEYYCKCDIALDSDRKNLLTYIDDKFGRLDLLVNNAGISCKVRMDILETSEESFDRLIAVNTKGTFFMCQLFARYMIACKQKGLDAYQARIVNISSNSSYTSSVSRGEYCISKAGVSMITTLFADKLGEYNIPVLEVRPGIIRTPMTEVVTEKYDKLIAQGITPFRRWGEPEDVAKCVLAVAKGYLDFSTGTAINADGGFHIKRL